MKGRCFYGVFLALLTACTSGQYRVDGIYTAEDGTPVWLIDQNAKDTLAGTAVQGGRFTFHGRVREPFYAYVGNGRQRVHFILEPGTAKVDIDGTDVKLSDYVGRGRYILLDHWASWCGPCKAEMPSIKKTWEAFHGDRFDVVSIAVSDKRADTEQALSALDMPWNQILDAQRIPLELYGVNAIPHLILFGPDGTILKRGLRGEDIYTTVADLLSR